MVMNPGFGLMTRASHVCDPGFELDGPMIRICMENPDDPDNPMGEWDQVAPRCQRK